MSRPGTRQIAIEGEKRSANNVVITGYVKQLNFEIINRGLAHEQINLYVTGLNLKTLPH